MDDKHKITIPKPCHENWNKMTPNENGRFCLSCAKTVVDFTSMLPYEVQHYFIQNQNEKICGRFKNSQLYSITIQIPDRVLYSQTNYSKMFLLALFVSMGTTLFSCANKDGKKKKIDKVEVVTDLTPTNDIIVGEPAIDETETKNAVIPPPPPPKVDQVKFIKPIEESKIKKSNSSRNETVETEDVSLKKEQAPKNAEFPGGIDQFHSFFMKEYKKPEGVSYWKLNFTLAFAVEKNGTVSFLECSPAIEEPLQKEIIRVLSVCPKWQPGESNGKKLKMQYSVPILLK